MVSSENEKSRERENLYRERWQESESLPGREQ